LSANLAIAADSAPIDVEHDFGPGSHERFVERVNTAQATDYQAVLAGYEARHEAHPDDVLSDIERCRFIESFAYSEDVAIESASDDLEACRKELHSGAHAKDVHVLLYGVESTWGEEKLPDAQALIPKSEHWSPAQRAALYELLAERTQWQDEQLAASYAVRAVDLDPASRVLLIAVNRWVQLGAKDRARRLLVEAPPKAWEKVSRSQAAKVLIELGDSKGAAAILRGGKPDDEGGEVNLILARVLASDGDIKGARELYDGVIKREFVALDTRIEYFEFERRHGTSAAALAAYGKLRDEGFHADSVARYRLGLLLSHPGAGWQWRDALGLLTLIGVALAICALPLIAIVPVHYRGLARQAAGRAPDLSQEPMDRMRWKLRHAWYALGVMLIAGYAALYVYAVQYLEATLPWIQRYVITPATDITLSKIMLWSSVAALLLLVPLLRGRSVKQLLLGTWSLKRCIVTGIAWALGLKIFAAFIDLGMKAFGLLGSDTVRAMQGLHEMYGLGVMLLVVAVATPIIEELIFRGVLLEAFRARVTFWVAAVVQALVFIALHEEWQAMPFLFVFALAAAWQVRESGGLLASMVMHAVNNATAAMAVVGATSILNR
jgi:membrane protease YdiL (CAAX protease family)